MARFYAVTLGRRGIRVNTVTPGTVIKEENREFYENNHKLKELFKEVIPLGRMGTSQEVAHVIEFLCGSKSSYITGHNIVVDGGLSLQWQESLARKFVRTIS